MTTSNPQVRRATVEDLPKLVPLWQEENLAVHDLEKRFKEFQVAEGPSGEFLGAIGLQIAGIEAHLHSEVFAHPEEADALRDCLWNRVQVLAGNHGLVRVWTHLATPFWHTNGFAAPADDALAKLPQAFKDRELPWLYIQLREEPVSRGPSFETEFALFREAEKQRTDRMLRQARALKVIAAAIAVLVFLLVVFWAVSFFRFQRGKDK